jgi:hypothetical protein
MLEYLQKYKKKHASEWKEEIADFHHCKLKQNPE